MVAVDAAYKWCERDARTHYENFPVASMLLPPAMRRHVAAVYAFARAADDFADEGNRSTDERLALLDGWGHRLRHAAVSVAPGPPPGPGEPAHAVAIFVALGHSMRERSLPVQLFEDLLQAFRQDVTVHRYATWSELLDYCRHSANPVGRLVLRIAGRPERDLESWSDAICTALQLTNFWQDLKIDFDRGRVYVPAEESRAHGAYDEDLAANHLSAPWRRALASASARTRLLFEQGRPLCDAVSGRLRYELRATWLGGTRILDRIQQADFDPFRRRPVLGFTDLCAIAAGTVTWRSGPLYVR